jgi:hypothetical protein
VAFAAGISNGKVTGQRESPTQSLNDVLFNTDIHMIKIFARLKCFII